MEIYTDDLGFRHQEFFHDLKVRFLFKGSLLYFYMFLLLRYYMRNFCNLIGLEQWYLSLI